MSSWPIKPSSLAAKGKHIYLALGFDCYAFARRRRQKSEMMMWKAWPKVNSLPVGSVDKLAVMMIIIMTMMVTLMMMRKRLDFYFTSTLASHTSVWKFSRRKSTGAGRR